MRRPPSRTHGILPVVRQLNNVRRLIGNRASNCFWLMKPASPDGVWFCSAHVPAFRMSALADGLTLKESFSLFIRPISYSSQLRILPGAGRAHRVIFTQNDVRDFGRNRREFYTGAQGRFGWQNEFSSRQQRVTIMFTILLPLQSQSAPCFCRVPSTESASANYRETKKWSASRTP